MFPKSMLLECTTMNGSKIFIRAFFTVGFFLAMSPLPVAADEELSEPIFAVDEISASGSANEHNESAESAFSNDLGFGEDSLPQVDSATDSTADSAMEAALEEVEAAAETIAAVQSIAEETAKTSDEESAEEVGDTQSSIEELTSLHTEEDEIEDSETPAAFHNDGTQTAPSPDNYLGDSYADCNDTVPGILVCTTRNLARKPAPNRVSGVYDDAHHLTFVFRRESEELEWRHSGTYEVTTYSRWQAPDELGGRRSSVLTEVTVQKYMSKDFPLSFLDHTATTTVRTEYQSSTTGERTTTHTWDFGNDRTIDQRAESRETIWLR